MATMVDAFSDDDVFRLLMTNDASIPPIDSDMVAFAASMMSGGDMQLPMGSMMDTEMTLAAVEQRQPPTGPLTPESEYYSSSSATSPKSNPNSPYSPSPLGSPQIAIDPAYAAGLTIFQVGDPLPTSSLTDPGDPNAKPTRRRKNVVLTAVTLPEEQLLKISSQELEEFARKIAMNRKLTPEEKKEIRRQRRLVKNREYATMSRAKKKTQVQQLESKLMSLESENAELRARNSALESEVISLKSTASSSAGSTQLCSRCSSDLMEAGRANILKSSWLSIGGGKTSAAHATGARAAQGFGLCIVLFSFAFFFIMPQSDQPNLSYNTGRMPLSAEVDAGSWWSVSAWRLPWSSRSHPSGALGGLGLGEQPDDRSGTKEKNDTKPIDNVGVDVDTKNDNEPDAEATVPGTVTCVFDHPTSHFPAGLMNELMGMPSCSPDFEKREAVRDP